MNTKLFDAIKAGNVQAVRNMLADDPSLAEQKKREWRLGIAHLETWCGCAPVSAQGKSALHYALEGGHTTIADAIRGASH